MRCSTVALLFCSAPIALGALPGAHAQTSARVTGHVLDASGRPQAAAVVRFVSDVTSSSGVHPVRYTSVGDSLGKFSQEGVAPGAYLVMVFTGGKGTDVLKHIQLLPGATVEMTLKTGAAGTQLASIVPPTDAPTKMSAQTR